MIKTNVEAYNMKSIKISPLKERKILSSRFNETLICFVETDSVDSVSTEIHSKITEIFLAVCELYTVQEILEVEDSSKWIEAINEELEFLKKVKHKF